MKKLFLLSILFFVLGCSEEDDEIDDLNSQISALSSQVAGLNSDLAQANFENNSLQAQNSALEQENQALQDMNDQLEFDISDGLESSEDVAQAIADAVADVANEEAVPDIPNLDTPSLDSILAAATDSFLKIHDNSAWKMTEEAFTEYTLFYNSEESPFKVHDFNGCNGSFDGNNILTDGSNFLMVDLNSNTVLFHYFENEDYMERVEGIYRDTLSRVESTANALWLELGCD